MPAASDRPLRKVTMNFYEDDVAYMVATYGSGWTSEVRQRLSDFITNRKLLQRHIDAGFGDKYNGS